MENIQGSCSCLPVMEKADKLKVLINNFLSIQSKKEELEILLLDNSIDIVLRSETHLTADIVIINSFSQHPNESEICKFLVVKTQTNRQPIINTNK